MKKLAIVVAVVVIGILMMRQVQANDARKSALCGAGANAQYGSDPSAAWSDVYNSCMRG